MMVNPETEPSIANRRPGSDSLPARCLTKLMSLRRKESPAPATQRPSMSIVPTSFSSLNSSGAPRKWPSQDGLQMLTKRVPSSPRYVPVLPPNEFYISISYENIYHPPMKHPHVKNRIEGHPSTLRGPPMGSCPDITKYPHGHRHSHTKRGDCRYPYDYVYGGTLREYVEHKAPHVYETVGSNYRACYERNRLKSSFYCNGYSSLQSRVLSPLSSKSSSASTSTGASTESAAPTPARLTHASMGTSSESAAPTPVRSYTSSNFWGVKISSNSSKLNATSERAFLKKASYLEDGSAVGRTAHDDTVPSRPNNSWLTARERERLALRIKMTSMHGLPPLPRSLSHEAARVNGGMEQSVVDWGSGPSARPERKGRTLPTPPATLSQDSETPRPLRHLTSSSEETKSIETNLATLRDEMYRLRQVDVALLAQMWSLNKAIQEFCRLQESPLPSPSDDGEDVGEVFNTKKKLPVSRRRYQQDDHKLSEGSSSSSTSVELGKV